MAKIILATKVGMSQLYTEKGTVAPVTVLEVGPNVVVQVKTKEKDGYEAVQIGTGKVKKTSKARLGHLKGLGMFRFLREFPVMAVGEEPLKQGDTLNLASFVPGDVVKVTGDSKGKGFAGGMKRHGFSGMPHSHGHHHVARHIGSIGQRFPQHTLKGKRMAGHMGAEQVTVRGLKVMHVDVERGLIALKGAVPGPRGSLLAVTTIK